MSQVDWTVAFAVSVYMICSITYVAYLLQRDNTAILKEAQVHFLKKGIPSYFISLSAHLLQENTI